jgi:G:T-mismatch repair DNA endonuclease (very short patch repair protein)
MKCIYCDKTTNNENHSCRSKRNFEKFGHHDRKIRELLLAGQSLNHVRTNSLALFGQEIPYHYLQNLCKLEGIKIRNMKESANCELVREKYKATVEKIYGEGITNVSQSKEVKQKKIDTNLAHYGVNNVFQSDEIKEKTKNTMVLRYGVEHPIYMENRKPTPGMLSKPHKKISDYLTDLGIAHLNDKRNKFKKFNVELGREYGPIPDILIEDKKIVIEIFGDRWHMNPLTFAPDDVVHFYTGNDTAVNVWNKDRVRTAHIESFGFQLIVIWESEINKKFEDIKIMLRNKLCQ